MTTSVLAYIPSPAQGVWHLGPVPLRAYALCIIVGIVAALIVGDRRWVARGGQAGVIYDIALWAVPFGLIGGRLYHVMTDWRTYFGDDGAGFGAALRIWDGGLGIWGAVALGGVGAWIGCRSRGIPLPAFGDAIAPGIVLAQAIGRLGNYFNQELYGRATTLPWGLEIYERRNSAGVLDSLNGVSTGQLVEVVHPTFLYELLWNLLIFAVLIYVDRRFKIGHGRLFALYVAGYCVGRFWVELMRSDMATHIAGIRINTFTSTFVFIAAVVYIMVAPKGREDPVTLKGNDIDEESLLDEIGEELVAVAATSGVVAAATVAGAEDKREDAVPESAAGGDAEPATVAAAVEDVDESESEDSDALAEADEDPEADDAEDEVDIEGAVPIGSESGPMSEQAEELAAEQEDEPEEGDESEAAAAGEDAEAESVEAAEEAIESEGSEPDEAEDEDEPDEAENEPEAVEAEPEPDAEPAESPELAEVKSDAEPEPDAVTEAADTEAAPVATEPEPEEGSGSVEGDEVVEAQQDAPEVHEAAVEGAEQAEAVAEEVAAEAEPAETEPAEVSEDTEAESAADGESAEFTEAKSAGEPEPEEGLGSVEGDEVVAAEQDAPEVHEAAVEGAEEAEAVAADVAAESESAESDPEPADEPDPAVAESEPADAAEPESDGSDPADAAEPEEGLSSVEGDEVVAAEQDAPEVHEAAVEGAEAAEAVAEEIAAEPEPAVQPVAEPPRGRWWRRRG
ncbi:prolipoprotein diacylglyceryl transferase [Mycobacterium sp. AZCC_0083]|uniref:prolipoprotein diacylglyceryl transferase n=1 Tax=Mycobacterium sp. AZCC_0083 TaxID=2735882 RepID=UPI00160E842C|nr:prolipoprotein diacylglyceryl transferase [Mycobacterium sp. AZCC_0083]MBB5160176.1 prolipoprotein diacylglyceryl transferase [Mycobacterium sp. AZCC_0083]